MIASDAGRADRMMWRRSSSVALSAQCRSSSTTGVGRMRDALSQQGGDRLEQSIPLALGIHGRRIRQIGDAASKLRDQQAELGASTSRRQVRLQIRFIAGAKHQLKHSTKGWYGTSSFLIAAPDERSWRLQRGLCASKFQGETGLADARFAGDEQQLMTPAPGGRPHLRSSDISSAARPAKSMASPASSCGGGGGNISRQS